ncbi:MAG: hypothetical protein A2219_08060 [Elusimicrobia bacterium RIFOXYA2_FULL_50_26]|nr:MAG: hypothetical protein A2219_08060 [Elusimicrobia bacterium RIFOXYA2_FULL_50_26]
MNRIEILEKKIRQAAGELTAIKGERRQLKAELEFLEKENIRIKDILKENNALKDEKRTIAHRIEKIVKKINVAMQ